MLTKPPTGAPGAFTEQARHRTCRRYAAPGGGLPDLALVPAALATRAHLISQYMTSAHPCLNRCSEGPGTLQGCPGPPRSAHRGSGLGACRLPGRHQVGPACPGQVSGGGMHCLARLSRMEAEADIEMMTFAPVQAEQRHATSFWPCLVQAAVHARRRAHAAAVRRERRLRAAADVPGKESAGRPPSAHACRLSLGSCQSTHSPGHPCWPGRLTRSWWSS